MKIGLMDLGMWHETHTQEEVINAIVAEAELADELGFYSFWTGEHHFTRHGIVADTMVMAAAIAMRTERIRIGTAVVVLPFHHPVRLAEQVAMVDILSSGRVDLGVGSGYQPREFGGLGVPMEEARQRYRDALEILMNCWAPGPLEYVSRFWDSRVDGDTLEVYPKPVQRPHPPIYQASSTSRASVDQAARLGIPIIGGGPTDILDLGRPRVNYWRAQMREYGHNPDGISIPLWKNMYVAPTDERAQSDYAAIDPEWDHRIVVRNGMPTDRNGQIVKGFEEWAERDRSVPTWQRSRPLVGSPDTVLERLLDLRSHGEDYVFGQFGMPDMRPDQVLSSIKLFGTEVLPHLKAAE